MFRKFWHKRAYQKGLRKSISEKKINQNFKIKKIRILVDGSLGIEAEFFFDLIREFSIAQTNLFILLFPCGHPVEKQYSNVFNPDDITYFGSFREELNLFCAKETDLQINYFNRSDLMMEWVANTSVSKLSAGFSGANEKINDLIFDFDPQEKETLKVELLKYLKILNKI